MAGRSGGYPGSAWRLTVDTSFTPRLADWANAAGHRRHPHLPSSESVWTLTGALVRAPRRAAIPQPAADTAANARPGLKLAGLLVEFSVGAGEVGEMTRMPDVVENAVGAGSEVEGARLGPAPYQPLASLAPAAGLLLTLAALAASVPDAQAQTNTERRYECGAGQRHERRDRRRGDHRHDSHRQRGERPARGDPHARRHGCSDRGHRNAAGVAH